MTDGAHLGVDAETAMRKIVGGEEVPDEKIVTIPELEARIRATPYDQEDWTYESTADAAARIVLEAYEKWPQLRDLTDRTVYLEPIDWSNPVALNVVLWDVIHKLHPEGTLEWGILSDLTGFMWGWAVNAARAILGLGPLPNPAIYELVLED